MKYVGMYILSSENNEFFLQLPNASKWKAYVFFHLPVNSILFFQG